MYLSPSTRRAWIEILLILVHIVYVLIVALHPEGVDRNHSSAWLMASEACKSPSTRRAWIEIRTLLPVGTTLLVALHPEGVDRNPATA